MSKGMSNIYLKVTVEKDWLLYICSGFYVYAENGLLPPVITILSFVLLNVTGMVQVVAVILLAHHIQHIHTFYYYDK